MAQYFLLITHCCTDKVVRRIREHCQLFVNQSASAIACYGVCYRTISRMVEKNFKLQPSDFFYMHSIQPIL
jgi:hypothetical protein